MCQGMPSCPWVFCGEPPCGRGLVGILWGRPQVRDRLSRHLRCLFRTWEPLYGAEQDGAARALGLGDARPAPIAFLAKRTPIE
jgi:hypothetical protein